MVSAIDLHVVVGLNSRYRIPHVSLKTFRPLWCPAHLDVPWIVYKVDRLALGDRQRHKVCMDDP